MMTDNSLLDNPFCKELDSWCTMVAHRIESISENVMELQSNIKQIEHDLAHAIKNIEKMEQTMDLFEQELVGNNHK